MTAKKRGLGKGLDALLGPNGVVNLSGIGQGEQLRNLPIDLITRGQYQPRFNIDAESLEELANSIRTQGVVQPIVVRPLPGSDKYEIIAGERRWRASQIAGLHEMPVLVRDVNDQVAMCLALIENIQREDLNPMDEARALSRFLNEFDMTHDAVAESIGRSRSTVTNYLRLLELHPDVQKMLEARHLEMGHARAILALPESKQLDCAQQVIKKGLSARATEALVRKLQLARKDKTSKEIDPNIRKLQDELSERLGAEVIIKYDSKGRGELKIRYSSLDELDGILGNFK